MTTEELTFDGAGGARLAARLELPAGPPRAYALFAHCLTCGKNLRSAVAISRALAAAGIATLRFDFAGVGESGGAFADTTLATNVDDLVAAAAFLAGRHEAPALLVGHSLGGAAALLAAPRFPAARAVVTIAAPSAAAQVTAHLAAALPEIEARGCAVVRFGDDSFPVTRQFLAALEATSLEAAAAALGRPLLICHSPQDRTVSIDAAARLYQAARHPKSFLSLDGADHLLSRERDAAYAAGVIAAWAARYLPDAPAAPPAADAHAPRSPPTPRPRAPGCG
jgi:putative redox protein